jgi:cytochrome c oxidase cbb3-type subunit 3
MPVPTLAAGLALAFLAIPALGASGSEAASDGRAIYNFRCYFCHGYSGNAKTVAASFLTPPPADFTAATPASLPESRIVATLKLGRPGTAMKSFASVLSEAEIASVARFVHDEFVVNKAVNTRYHTPENGWPDHERYRIAFPFATGEIGMSQSWESLTEEQARGKRLFLGTCITCHDRGPGERDDSTWDTRPLSYPRNNFSFTAPPKPDAIASASPYAMHDVRPRLKGLTRSERLGEKLFQGNCAFCHAADGTGKNWIGSFLEPHPRNLRDPAFMAQMTRPRFMAVVGDGLPNTSMPAWKNVLSVREIGAIADYVSRAFHPLPASPPNPPGQRP